MILTVTQRLAYTPAQITWKGGLRMLLTVKDLEKLSQISRYTWRALIAQGKLPVIRAGRRVRIEEEAFREFLRKCRVPARDEAVQDHGAPATGKRGKP